MANYISKYFTAEEIDQRLLQGYYDDAVKAGYTGTKQQLLTSIIKSLYHTVLSGSINFFNEDGKLYIGYKNLDDNSDPIKVVLPEATNKSSGLLSSEDKNLIDKISESTEVSDIDKVVLILAYTSDGNFIKLSPKSIRDLTTKYVTKNEYADLVSSGNLDENIEYNIIEDEQVLE